MESYRGGLQTRTEQSSEAVAMRSQAVLNALQLTASECPAS